MPLLEVTLPWDPIPKGRPRTGNGTTYTPARTRQAEKDVVTYLRHALRGRKPVTCPVGLKVQFYCATRRRVDGDNLLKLATDAMNKIVIADDSQIEEWFCRIHRGVGKIDARTEIVVYELEDAPDRLVKSPRTGLPSAHVHWRPTQMRTRYR